MSYTLAYTGAEIDALLGKIDAIFVAEYGSTIYSEVTAAIAAGNKVIVANAGKVYVYAGQDDNSGYVFTQSGPNAAKPNATYVTLSTGNVWSTATVDLATLQQFYASLMEDTASGSIASFPDGAEAVPVKELTADIEPIQDLHGYDNPWPAGGGKNKLQNNASSTTSAGVTYTVNADGTVSTANTATGNTTLTIGSVTRESGKDYVISGCPSSGSTTTYRLFVQLLESGTGVYSYSETGSGLTIPSSAYSNADEIKVSISIANGTNVSDKVFKPMVCLSTETDPTVFAPYSNICPISGYTGAEIKDGGNNLCWHGYAKQDNTLGSITENVNTISWDFGGSATLGLFLLAPIENGKTYTLKGSCTASMANIRIYTDTSAGGALQNIAASVAAGSFEYTFTAAMAGVIRLYMDAYSGTFTNLQLNEGATALDYQLPVPHSYSVSWTDEGTVYKGTAEYKGDGEWEITPTYADIDLSTQTWNAVSSTRWVSGAISGIKMPLDNTTVTTAISDSFKAYSNDGLISAEPAMGFAVDQNSCIRVRNGSTTIPPTGHVLYPLASPTSFTVTGPDPETLLGNNNIWSNTGDISVKYRANTALYIEKKLGGNVQTLSMSRTAPTLGRTIAADLGSLEEEHPELDELTEAPELEPYEEPEAEEPEEIEELTEEPEEEEEPEAPEEVR